MPLTTLDPRTALVVIDLQKGLAAYPTNQPLADVAEKAAALAAAFRRHGQPVVLVNVTGVAPGRTEQPRAPRSFPADFAEFLPVLDQQPADHVVSKRTWGAFMNTDLDAWLKGQGVTQVVIVGVATSVGVESTARQAYEHGYNVALAVDAMADMSAEAHAHSIAAIFPKLGETGTSQAVIGLLDAAA